MLERLPYTRVVTLPIPFPFPDYFSTPLPGWNFLLHWHNREILRLQLTKTEHAFINSEPPLGLSQPACVCFKCRPYLCMHEVDPAAVTVNFPLHATITIVAQISNFLVTL